MRERTHYFEVEGNGPQHIVVVKLEVLFVYRAVQEFPLVQPGRGISGTATGGLDA